jgi:hypothetical protein
MATGFDFNAFAKLKLNANDVTGSWKNWLSEFELCVEMTTLKMGKETVASEQVDRFRGRLKLLALLHSVGKEGRDVLQSSGFNSGAEDSTYEQAMVLLKNLYDRQESVYVKTMRFVNVSQVLGEDEREYLLRVEKLSRNMDFGPTNDDLRKRFALALAVNGLREPSLRTQLMQEAELTWEKLTTTLRARHLARESASIVEEVKSGQYGLKREIKQEVAAVSAKNRAESDGSGSDRSSGRRVVRKMARKERSRTYDRGSSSRGRESSNSSRSSVENDDRGRFSPEWKRRGSFGRYSSPGKEDMFFFGCDRVGHQLRRCPSVRCYTCDKRGHTSVDCPQRRYEKKGKREKYDKYERARSSSDSSRSPARRVRFSESGGKS